MKQVVRKGLGQMAVEEVPMPVVGSHHLLIENRASLISSGTETASIHPSVVREVAKNPQHLRTVLYAVGEKGPLRTASEVLAKFSELAVMGYAGAGTVREVHRTVTGVTVGDRVAYGGEGTGHAQYVVTGQNLVASIPDAVPFDEAAFTTLGSIALNGVRTADIDVGDSVLVLGLGIVGQLTAQLAAVAGGHVYAADLLPERVALAQSLAGAVAIRDASTPEEVLSLTDGRGVDCVIIAAASKSDAPARIALESVRDRGRIVVVGAVDVRFPWLGAYLKEVKVLMARAYGPGSYDHTYEREGQDYPLPYVRWTEKRNMEEFLRLVASGRVEVGPLISHRVPLSEAPSGYETVMGSDSSMGVVITYDREEMREAGRRHRIAVTKAAPKSGEINVALVGAGNIARWAHMPALKKAEGATLRAVYSSSGVRGKSYASRYGAQYCTTDYGEILADREVDAVIVASRNQHHARQSIEALRAGKHVFVEKPLALTEEECGELLSAYEGAAALLTVGFNRRYAPSYRSMHAAMRHRAGPYVVSCRMNSPGISGDYWMADPAIGGAILGEACHFVDLMAWLLECEPTSVHAFSFDPGLTEPVGQNNVGATFHFEDGSVGTLTYCTVGSTSSQGERVEVFMPGHGLLAQDFKRFESLGARASRKSSLFPKKGYAAQMADFIDGCRAGEQRGADMRDGIRSTIACLRILESALDGQPKVIDWTRLVP